MKVAVKDQMYLSSSQLKLIIYDYKISNKLITKIYDDAPFISGNVGGVQAKINENYSEAIFGLCFIAIR